MSKKQITVSDALNEHSNPIAELVQVACRYESNISIESNNKKINAKSIMGGGQITVSDVGVDRLF